MLLLVSSQLNEEQDSEPEKREKEPDGWNDDERGDAQREDELGHGPEAVRS